MRTIVDTSSLLSLVRYYLPFDTGKVLFKYIADEIMNGNMILLDRIHHECEYISGGIIMDSLNFLKNKKIVTKTDNIVPPQKFYNMLDNNFVNRSSANRIERSLYLTERDNYLKNSGDAMIIVYAMRYIGFEKLQVLTEETSAANDNKLYKKIPSICRELNIDTITFPQYLKTQTGLAVSIDIPR